MPKRSDIHSILIIGAGPIVIGQACEFDYAGAQACKALREEGYRVILVNSNPATIMTDADMADAIYIEPIDWQVVERIIARERPDAILPTMGGQTALNCALALHTNGVLAAHGVELIGASFDAIDKAENRARFKDAMTRIGLASARSAVAHDMAGAWRAQQGLGFPVVIRPSFTMGGSGGGIARDADEFHAICTRGLALSPTGEVLIEESLLGWKEFEMEVVRDRLDNCIIVCAIENLDPMGVHTGDSITVAPAQTLTDREYQRMRDASMAVLREIGVDTGGSNVQFAVNPVDGRLVVIEMNPRVSRSSALASKATGFPIAKVAAKLAVGFTLDELRNDITGGATPGSFEPAIDYVVTKIPRFAFEKFAGADDRLGTQMKSVGEVMAIGRSFQQSLQKALRALDIGVDGLQRLHSGRQLVEDELALPGPSRIFYVAEAFVHGMAVEAVARLSAIDPWFLAQIEELVQVERWLEQQSLDGIDAAVLRSVKRQGFSDRRLATLLGVQEDAVRAHRHALGVRPVYKRVDSCAGEFASHSAYLYSSYEQQCEAQPSGRRKIMVLGGGPNRIGQGIEFDYCCVHAALALRDDGFETIMVNCNPETVSTDHDSADRLYFEPVTLEDVLEIVAVEQPEGVIVQYGGQTPLKLARALAQHGVPVIGTSPDMIDAAEDRERFRQLLQELDLRQPQNRSARTEAEALRAAEEIGYPLVVRPSYVLGGRAMEIVHQRGDLERYMREAVKVSHDAPVLLDRYLDNAIEVDVDCVCDGATVLIGGVMEHVEPAGVHSGDSACSLPPYSLAPHLVAEIERQTRRLALGLNVVGLMNVQFAIQRKSEGGAAVGDGEHGEHGGHGGHDVIHVLEVNPRASRTVPFVAKASGLALAAIGARCMVGQTISQQLIDFADERALLRGAPGATVCVKEAVFPFAKFHGVDTALGPEMRSTGEVMGSGHSFGEAYYKAQLAAGVRLPTAGLVYLRVRRADQARALALARCLLDGGFTLAASHATACVLQAGGLAVTPVDDEAALLDAIGRQAFAMLVVTCDVGRSAVAASRPLRVAALAAGSVICTSMAAAEASVAAMAHAYTFDVLTLAHLQAAGEPPAPQPRATPGVADLHAAATLDERRRRPRGPRGAGGPGVSVDQSEPEEAPLKLFIRQPFTESDEQQRALVGAILRLIDSANGAPRAFHYLTGTNAHSAVTFKAAFEREAKRPFTPQRFRRHRLALLDQADVMVNIRVGMSESSAFEMAQFILEGRRRPLLFLVWKQAPIKTTLLRDLEDMVEVTYLEFDEVAELRPGIHAFFQSLQPAKGIESCSLK